MKARIYNRVVDIADERLAKGGVDSDTRQGLVNKDSARKPTSKNRGWSNSQAQARGTSEPLPAGAIPAPSPLPGWPKPTDKWNYLFAKHLELEKQAGRIKYWWYEMFTILLPGNVRYKPDFLIQYPDGLERTLHFIEIKGWSPNVRDGITRYKIAAALFPCFTWSMMKRVGHGWEEYK